MVIYVGSDPKRDSSMFYLNLLWALMSQGQSRGYEMVPLIEQRPNAMAVLRPSDFDRVQAQGRVDGIVSFMIYELVSQWMDETGLPWTALMGGGRDNYVDLDYGGMIRSSLACLAERGCRSAGLILPVNKTQSTILELIDEEAARLGIEVKYEWILATRQSQEEGGYNDMCALWRLKDRPEGLVVYPDRTARGVVSAILEKQIRVPEDLRLILHRNAESPYMVPMPCDWIEVSVGAIASSLLDSLEDRWAGRKQRQRSLPINLVRGGV